MSIMLLEYYKKRKKEWNQIYLLWIVGRVFPGQLVRKLIKKYIWIFFMTFFLRSRIKR